MPKVSVCIPAYNQPELLKQTIESVLMQTYTDYEIIITDDSPGDEVKRVVDAFGKNEKIIYSKNPKALGSPANWNFCISKAKGDYIKIIHHDDFLTEKDSLSLFVKALDENTNASMAFSQSKVFNQPNRSERIHIVNAERLAQIKGNPNQLLIGNSIGAPSAIIYRKTAITFDENLKWLVDLDFYIKLLNANKNSGNTPNSELRTPNFVYIEKPLITTTDGAAHQVTQICQGNPEIELKEYCYVLENLNLPEADLKIFEPLYLGLLAGYNLTDFNQLRAYAPFISKKKIFFESIILKVPAYMENKNRRSKVKELLKNKFTFFLYKQYLMFKNKRRFRKELSEFTRAAKGKTQRFSLDKKDLFPVLDENTANTSFDRHYVYHLGWAARVVKEINPVEHVDIASLLYFPTVISAFIKTKYYDYRPAQLNLNNLTSEKADLTKLHFADNSIPSLSCMHTVEHVGLGRYGDPIDYDGDLKAINELKRVTAVKGNLLFVVPVGKSRIQFNAHRIYSYEQVVNSFSGFELKEFALIPDNENEGGLIRNATKEQSDRQSYACGCFWFVKK